MAKKQKPKKQKLEQLMITNQLRTLRFAAGELTQQQLADRVGVSRQTINSIESIKYFPSLEVAFRIAKALKTPIDKVFECEWDEPGCVRIRH